MPRTATQPAAHPSPAGALRTTQREAQSHCVALLTTVATLIGAYDLLLVVLAV